MLRTRGWKSRRRKRRSAANQAAGDGGRNAASSYAAHCLATQAMQFVVVPRRPSRPAVRRVGQAGAEGGIGRRSRGRLNWRVKVPPRYAPGAA